MFYKKLIELSRENVNVLTMYLGMAIMAIVLVNIVFSPYARHNRLVAHSSNCLRVSARTNKLAKFYLSVPSCYRSQWHCYVTAGSCKASKMFTPIESKSRWLFLRLYIACYLCVLWLIVVCSSSELVLPLSLYVSAILPSLWLVDASNKWHYDGAVKRFVKYVAMIEAYFGNGNVESDHVTTDGEVNTLVSQIKLLASSSDSEKYAKISRLLASQPLSCRSTCQQRKINCVLNGLAIPPNGGVKESYLTEPTLLPLQG